MLCCAETCIVKADGIINVFHASLSICMSVVGVEQKVHGNEQVLGLRRIRKFSAAVIDSEKAPRIRDPTSQHWEDQQSTLSHPTSIPPRPRSFFARKEEYSPWSPPECSALPRAWCRRQLPALLSVSAPSQSRDTMLPRAASRR